MSVTNETTWPFWGIGHRRLWPKKRSQILWPNYLVTGNPDRPRQIQRGRADVANLWPNKMVADQNQPSPIRCFTWAEPNNSTYFYIFFPANLINYMGKAQHFSHYIFGPWPFWPNSSSFFIGGSTSQMGPNCQIPEGGPQLSDSGKWVPIVMVLFFIFQFDSKWINNI